MNSARLAMMVLLCLTGCSVSLPAKQKFVSEQDIASALDATADAADAPEVAVEPDTEQDAPDVPDTHDAADAQTIDAKPTCTAAGCNDGNPCTDDGCDSKSGACTHANQLDGAACDDGNGCTTGDNCTAGKCGGAGKNCDDGNPCTADSCADNVCGYAYTTAACEDGSACTVADKCAGGVCVGGAAPNCDDGNTCTDDSCNATGCAYAANTGSCSLNNACTVADVCTAKACKAGAPLDADGDGYAPVNCGGTDCDDSKPAVNPGKTESCTTVGVDDNCDGKADEGCGAPSDCGADGGSCGGGKGKCSSGHCFWTDAKGYKWTLVPAGTFWMGCNAAVDSGCDSNEKPQHLIDMSAYWIGVYEVTVANYKACVDGAGAGCTAPVGTTYATWGVAGKEQHPVNYMNWAQSQSYCKWLGGDLPSEAQWEKAAKGGCEVYAGKGCATSESTYPWGNSAPVCGQQAVFQTTGYGCNTGSTYAVGAGSAQGASPYGAYDMAGNVWEWTLDWYDSAFYGKAAAMLKDAVNSASASRRVMRGGGFGHGATNLRAGSRTSDYPSVAGTYVHFGVRCVRSVP